MLHATKFFSEMINCRLCEFHTNGIKQKNNEKGVLGTSIKSVGFFHNKC